MSDKTIKDAWNLPAYEPTRVNQWVIDFHDRYDNSILFPSYTISSCEIDYKNKKLTLHMYDAVCITDQDTNFWDFMIQLMKDGERSVKNFILVKYLHGSRLLKEDRYFINDVLEFYKNLDYSGTGLAQYVITLSIEL